jgi:hypothetical protein
MRYPLLVLVTAACGSASHGAPVTQASDYTEVCRAIAGDIERIGRGYPQLVDYRAVDAHIEAQSCRIDYGYRTHRATHVGGWSAGVPNPDPDGIWFYISLWDPQSAEASSQINTQPVMPSWWIGDRRVTFLVLEGDRNPPVRDKLFDILETHQLVTK